MKLYVGLYSPILVFASKSETVFDTQVREFASTVDEKSNACVPLLEETLKGAVDRFNGNSDDTSENIRHFVQETLLTLSPAEERIPSYCGDNMVFRSISRDQVERILSILSAPAKSIFEAEINGADQKRSVGYVSPAAVNALLKCFHIAYEVLGPLMQKYAEISSVGQLRLTCTQNSYLKEIIAGKGSGFADKPAVESTIKFLGMLFRGDLCYHGISGNPSHLAPGEFESFRKDFVEVVAGVRPPLSSPVPAPNEATVSIKSHLNSESSSPNPPDRFLSASSAEPRRIEEQSFRSLSVVNQESIFFSNLELVVYRISRLSVDSVHAAIHIRTLDSYSMVLIKALDQLNQLQTSHKNIEAKLTSVLGELRTAIGKSESTESRDV